MVHAILPVTESVRLLGALRRPLSGGDASPLEQLAGCKIPNQSSVSGKKIVGWQVLEPDPAYLLVDVVDDLSVEFAHGEELQIDCAAVAVVVANPRDRWTNTGVDAKLFGELAGQRLLGAFSGLDLTSRKLPHRGHRLIGTTLPDQHLTVANNQRRGYKSQGRAGGTGTSIRGAFFHRSSVNETKEMDFILRRPLLPSSLLRLDGSTPSPALPLRRAKPARD